MNSKDVIIIGAGPAGIATAIQLKRYAIDTVLLEKEEIGGLLRNANLVENYPGFPEGISGLNLVELFKKQLEHTGVTVGFEMVLELEYKDEMFFTKTNERTIRSNIAVIATGTKPKKISSSPVDRKVLRFPEYYIETFSDEIKNRIFYEVYPIHGIKNKKIAIIGAGDAAFDYALNLSQKNEVIILNRNKRAKCIPVLKEKCMKSDNISYLCDVSVREISNDGDKFLLSYTCGDSRDKIQIETDYVIAAIGREPCFDFLGSELKKNFENLINADRLYMVGDIKNEMYRQTAICAGDGIKAAMKIYNKIGRASL